MSVYIEGVDIPEGHSAISIKLWPDGEVEVIDAEGEWSTTTAISVPDHGRLIDADALGDFPYNMDFCDGGEADEWVRNAPTVIPASGGKENE